MIGKKRLAKIYLLRSRDSADLGNITEDSPITSKDGYLKFKNYKWTFYGLSKTKARYSNVTETRTAFLLNPTGPIIAAIRHSIPEELKTIHAFEDPALVNKLLKIKLRLSLISSPKTPSLKEKLFKSQKGICSMCNKIINFDSLHYNYVHIHHIEPIKRGGNKFALNNLTLVHS